MIRKQVEFPLLEEYAKVFPITENTIFAYDGEIYANDDLPLHLIEHENTHLAQQERDGLDYWIREYLSNPAYRLTQELEAYTAQLKSIKNREDRNKVRLESARTLSSELYGNIITLKEALDKLKVV